LALNRGDREGILKTRLRVDDERLVDALRARFGHGTPSRSGSQLELALQDGYDRLLRPAIERDLRAEHTAQAEQHAIRVFAENLHDLLLQPPVHNVRVMGVDPAYRTGCKIAVVDETGDLLATMTVYPHAPQNHRAQAAKQLHSMIAEHRVQVIAIGNGTASRETEALVAELITDGATVKYAMVSEAGASVYSASPLAAAELPGLDVSMRGAVSIARRLQDPLAELVKIPPQSIGVGLYQHDVDQGALANALNDIVESAVNQVGVDLNTASPALLERVSGLGATLADRIVAHRNAHGPFRTRHDLLDVHGLGPKTFQQAAGFLRIRSGEEPLDNTAIHPESYEACSHLLHLMGHRAQQPLHPSRLREAWQDLTASRAPAEIADTIGVGQPTMHDMVDNLLKPGRDPRDELPPPVLRSDLLTMDDLCEGMVLKGTVRNVVDFGAFVDIGVKQDGLVHISQLSERFVQDPRQIVRTGQVVRVRILSVDQNRQRIGLTMKGVPQTE
jgi:protein Tex